MALAVVWVAVLLGSVELAASVCAYMMFMCICMYVGGQMEVVACSRLHVCMHAFVHSNIT